MATYNKFNAFVEDIHNKVHDLANDEIKVVLANNTNPPVATDSIFTDLIGAVSMANAGDVTVTTTSSTETAGVYALVLVDKVLTATGAVGPFQWVVLYNDTSTNKSLIGYYDYGTEISLATSETFSLDFDPTGLFQTT